MTQAVQQARQPIAHITQLPCVVIKNVISLTPLGKVRDIHVGLTSIQNPNGDQIEACNFAKRCMDLRNHPEVCLEIRQALKPAGSPAAEEKLWTFPTDDLTYDELMFVHRSIRKTLIEHIENLSTQELSSLLEIATLKGCAELVQTIIQSHLFNTISENTLHNLFTTSPDDHQERWLKTLAIIANTPRFNSLALTDSYTSGLNLRLIDCALYGNLELLSAILKIPHFPVDENNYLFLRGALHEALRRGFPEIVEHVLMLNDRPYPKALIVSDALDILGESFRGDLVRSLLKKPCFHHHLENSYHSLSRLLSQASSQGDAKTVEFLLNYLDQYYLLTLKDLPLHHLLGPIIHPVNFLSSSHKKTREVISRHKPLPMTWIFGLTSVISTRAIITGLATAAVYSGLTPVGGLAGSILTSEATICAVSRVAMLTGVTIYSTEHIHGYHLPGIIELQSAIENNSSHVINTVHSVITKTRNIASRVFSFFGGR